MAADRLTPRQVELLTELAENKASGYGDGGWYIRPYSRQDRTAVALAQRGLAKTDRLGDYRREHWVITDAGLEWLAARNAPVAGEAHDAR